MLETSLYPVVKRFLETAGFHVKGEVNGCDVVAVEDGEQQRLAIVEMKRGFNLDLLLQAVERMRNADEVWLAVPATSRGRDRDPRVRRLCRPSALLRPRARHRCCLCPRLSYRCGTSRC